MGPRPRKSGPRNTQDAEASEPRTYSEGAQKILLTAEKMFGEHGLNGVSMRQILLAAGHGNKAGVYHHFGSKEGLIQAVFDMRMPALDEVRRRRLQVADENGPVGVKELLEALLLPIANIPQSKSRIACAQFLLQLLQVSRQHMIVRWKNRSGTAEIDRRLRDQVADLPEAVFQTRFRLASVLFLTGIAWPDPRLARTRQEAATYHDDLITMAAAAFQPPVPGKAAAQIQAPRPESRPITRRSTRSTGSGKPK